MDHIYKRKVSTMTMVNADGSKTVVRCGPPDLTPEEVQFLDGLIYLIGMEYSEKLREEVSQKTGRPVRPNGNRTVKLNYDARRINLFLDSNDVITQLDLG